MGDTAAHTEFDFEIDDAGLEELARRGAWNANPDPRAGAGTGNDSGEETEEVEEEDTEMRKLKVPLNLEPKQNIVFLNL